MYFVYKLNKQGDNIQPWCTRFPIWNQSVVPCPVLTVASWTAYRFLSRQVRWAGIPISWRIFQFVGIHTVKGFCTINKAEVDGFFLEFFHFYYDPTDVGNFISDSYAFSKSSLSTIHVLLKPGLENFEHYFSRCEMSAGVWQFEQSLALPFLGTGMKTNLFYSCGPCWVFQICWHIECSIFTASSFRIWNSSAEFHHL